MLPFKAMISRLSYSAPYVSAIREQQCGLPPNASMSCKSSSMDLFSTKARDFRSKTAPRYCKIAAKQFKDRHPVRSLDEKQGAIINSFDKRFVNVSGHLVE